MPSSRSIFVLAGLLMVLPAVESVPTPALAVPPLDPEHRVWATVLAAVARADGVDYSALRADTTSLDRYRAQLAAARAPQGRAETMTLFINAYNAATLALVVSQLPEDRTQWPRWSIRQAGSLLTSVWKTYDFEVAGSRYTLDAMEHAVLRPLGDPRIHLAINCASRSCPPLIAQPFLVTTLDEQLAAATRVFANSPYHLRLTNGQLQVNPILDWFSADFTAGGGIRPFLQAHVAAGPVAQHLAADRPIVFFDYDWTLNLAVQP